MEWQWPWYLLALGLAIALVLEGCISQDEIRKQEAQRGSEMCREAHERNACNVTPSCLLNTCVRPFSCGYDTLSDGITGGGYIEMCRCQWVGSNISESRSCIANAVKNYTDTTWFCEDLRYYNELDRRMERDDENCSCEVCNDTLFAGGRLFTHSGYAQTARIVTGEDDDWSFGPKASPNLGKVSAEVKNKVEWHYKLQGLAEHASVASFSRTILQLMALGAPASLVDRTLTAAREEVQHARMAFALARAISDPFKVSALKLDGVVIEAPNLTEFIEQTIAEACVAETVAVLRAAAALHFAEDKEVRAFLRVIIEEEQRHAKLAWSTLAWALLNAGMDQTARNAARNAIASEIDKLQVRKQEEAQEDVVTAKLLRLGILSRDLDMTAVGDAVILVERLGVELSSLSKTSSLEDFDQVVSGLFEISLKSDKVWTQSGHVATEV